jgi:glucoside 3-dehydrogenase (cytochrome c) hitch-hiker subunit
MTSLTSESMTRREAVLRVSALLGGAALVGQSALLGGCAAESGTRPSTGRLLSRSAIAFLDEIADTILPETSTPGAKAAGVGAFMAVMVADTYDGTEQAIFRAGLRSLDDECRAMHGLDFMSCTPAQRLALVERLDREQFDYMNSRAPGAPVHYFRMIKELSLLGYFTSEIGYRQAMRYVETPGRFDPCLPYSPGDRSWASHA